MQCILFSFYFNENAPKYKKKYFICPLFDDFAILQPLPVFENLEYLGYSWTNLAA